jgi:hypothetical protein
MDEFHMDKIREIIRKLVAIANGEALTLTSQEAYIVVRIIDLTEGFIRTVNTDNIFKGIEYRSNK